MGRIAGIIISEIKKYRNSKIVDFKALQAAKMNVQLMEDELKNSDFSKHDPLHALYIYALNRASFFSERISEYPVCEELTEIGIEAEDLYLPGGPPMSPLTKSYFNGWILLDMAVGVEKETFTSIMIDIQKYLKEIPSIISIFENMQNSRMGLYINEGNDNRFVYLRELYTNKEIKTHVTSGYYGKRGELWFVRLLPPIGSGFDYFISLNTPYVIKKVKYPKSSLKINNRTNYEEKEWIDFINRNIEKTGQKDAESALYHFMKYGLSMFYWPEYIFQAYINYKFDAVFLTGFPDRPETLPFSDI